MLPRLRCVVRFCGCGCGLKCKPSYKVDVDVDVDWKLHAASIVGADVVDDVVDIL